MYLISHHISVVCYIGNERNFDVRHTPPHTGAIIGDPHYRSCLTLSHLTGRMRDTWMYLTSRHFDSWILQIWDTLSCIFHDVTSIHFTVRMRGTLTYLTSPHIDSTYSKNERHLYKASYREWEKHRCSLRNVMLISRCSQHFLQWESETLHVISMIASHLVGSQEKWEKFLTSRHNASYTKYKICFYAGSWVKGCKSLLEIRRKLWN